MSTIVKKFIYVFFFLITLGSNTSFTLERITSFDTTIVIHKNASIKITEHIALVSEGKHIKYGFVRELPLIYKNPKGSTYIQEVLINGNKYSFKLKHEDNKKKIYIGDKRKTLQPGIHTFSITYTGNHLLDFSEDQGKLFWNVTGSHWSIPIEQASLTISTPKPFSQIPNNQKGPHKSLIQSDGSMKLITRQKLKPYQDFSITVKLPKGAVIKPDRSANEKLNHLAMLTLLLLFLLLFIFYLGVYCINKKHRQSQQTLIPLFKPPSTMSPGKASYLNHHGNNCFVLVCELVDMARAGYIIIEKKKKGLFRFKTYCLQSAITDVSKVAPTLQHNLHENMHELLFEGSQFGKSVILGKSDPEILQSFDSAFKDDMNEEFWGSHIRLLTRHFLGGLIVTSLCAIFPIMQLYRNNFLPPISLFIVGIIFLTFAFYYHLRIYTPKGKQLIAELNRFKIFLSGNYKKETESTPDLTIELYEKYLPYAIALEVEEQWTKQFRSLFERMKEDGCSYFPIWYTDNTTDEFNPYRFAKQFRKCFGKALAKALTARR